MRRPDATSGRGRLALLSVVLSVGTFACNREARVHHERLARALEPGIAQLCLADPGKESGGCFGDCAVRNLARKGRALRLAGELLQATAPVPVAETEAELERVRKQARAVVLVLGEACTQDFASDQKVTPAMRQCAIARDKLHAPFGKLRDAAAKLASSTEERSGVELPSPERCPEER